MNRRGFLGGLIATSAVPPPTEQTPWCLTRVDPYCPSYEMHILDFGTGIIKIVPVKPEAILARYVHQVRPEIRALICGTTQESRATVTFGG